MGLLLITLLKKSRKMLFAFYESPRTSLSLAGLTNKPHQRRGGASARFRRNRSSGAARRRRSRSRCAPERGCLRSRLGLEKPNKSRSDLRAQGFGAAAPYKIGWLRQQPGEPLRGSPQSLLCSLCSSYFADLDQFNVEYKR